MGIIVIGNQFVAELTLVFLRIIRKNVNVVGALAVGTFLEPSFTNEFRDLVVDRMRNTQ